MQVKRQIDRLPAGEARSRLAQMYSLLELAVAAYAEDARGDAADHAGYLANVAEAFAESMKPQAEHDVAGSSG